MGNFGSRAGPKARLELGTLEDRCTPAVLWNVGAASDKVASFVVNDGAAQRSMVNSIQINFNQQVNLNESGGQLHLLRSTADAWVEVPFTNAQVTTNQDGNTWVRYVGPSSSDAIIIDGDYKIVLTASRYSADNEVVGSLHSLYGDVNGDRTVDQADYEAFRSALGTNASQRNYAWYLDVNHDSSINIVDYVAFRANLGTSV
ncbi:MAG: dockerin type I repeat-containing protein [Gemmataceae bacterium]